MNERSLLSNMQLGELNDVWREIAYAPSTPENCVVRGWVIDEMESRLTPERFEKWLDTDEVK